ncbi:hypothetical protein HKX48_009119 [Thoreauomyces humboldtii]|nr:hypothetical protein HKX48_009119 [Thoreauomyces humboldtii]
MSSPCDPRPTPGCPVAPISVDSPDYNRGYIRSSGFDEALSMTRCRPTIKLVLADPDQGIPFSYLRYQSLSRIMLPGSDNLTDESFARDMTTFLATHRSEGRQGCPVEISTGIAPFDNLSDSTLTSFGFVLEPPKKDGRPQFAVRRFANHPPPAPSAVLAPVADAFDILPTAPHDAYFQKRVDLEKKMFPYGEAYLSNLPGALTHMCDVGSDRHWVAVDRTTDLVVSYTTMRYGRGIAYLQNAGTEQAYRRKGLSRALHEMAANDALERGFDGMATNGFDDQAWACWIAMGFVEDRSPFKHWELKMSE